MARKLLILGSMEPIPDRLLVTWNFRHIANAAMRARIEYVCRRAGYEPPIICTSNELLETDHEDNTE